MKKLIVILVALSALLIFTGCSDKKDQEQEITWADVGRRFQELQRISGEAMQEIADMNLD